MVEHVVRHPRGPRRFTRATLGGLMALGLVLGAATAYGQSEGTGGQSVEQLRDQGVLYFKRRLYKQAKRTFDIAIRRPGGRDDFVVVLYRGQTAEKLLMLEEAFAMAERAQALGLKNPQRRQAASEFLGHLTESYGPVTFRRMGGTSRGTLHLASEARIIIKQKQAMFLSIRERLRSTEIELPTTIYLPFGQYSAHGVPFTVKKGEHPKVAIRLGAVSQAADDDGISPWWYAGAGAAVLAGVGAFLLLQEDDVTTRTDTRFELER
ncbi:MAG: hypothetical protein ACE366_27270 [Bradymonadia bacterium]